MAPATVYVAHTGEQLSADPVSVASTDSLRAWIARNTGIPADRQILMTARGKNVRRETLAGENEIFVYDRLYVSDHSINRMPETPLPVPFAPKPPPCRLDDQNDVDAWRRLYSARRTWALKLASDCAPISQRVNTQLAQAAVIRRGVDVALENLKTHVAGIEGRFQETQEWANDALRDQQAIVDGWRDALGTLRAIPAPTDFSFLRRPSTPKQHASPSTRTLIDYIDVDQVTRAGERVAHVSQSFVHQLDQVEREVAEIAAQTEAAVSQSPLNEPPQPQPQQQSSVSPVNDDTSQLLVELEAFVKKISSDYEHVLTLPDNSKALANVSRTALTHTKHLLPSMLEVSNELQASLKQAILHRNEATRTSIDRMRLISTIQSRLAAVNQNIRAIEFDGEPFEAAFEPFQMPVVYGSALVEAVRRREWRERLEASSAALTEQLAVFREDAERARRRWLETMGDFVSVPDERAPAIEVHVTGADDGWPLVTRKHVEDYIASLRARPRQESAVNELDRLYRSLDGKPKRKSLGSSMGGFKNGSVLDAMQNSLYGHDDTVRSLRDDKKKLEDRLRGSESRVRKLEDLLHRQNNTSRPVSSANFEPSTPLSPFPDTLPRFPSSSSRRQSGGNQAAEDKALEQRNAALTSELQRVQEECHNQRQSIVDRFQEAQSTKNDLMENIQAREREFVDERKLLESENKQLHHKLEEVEEELDRAGVHEREALEDVEAQLAAANQALDAAMAATADHAQALQAVHSSLSPDRAPPDELGALVEAVEILVEGQGIHARGAEASAVRATEENVELEERLRFAETEAHGLRGRLAEEQAEAADLRERLPEIDEVSTLRGRLSELEQLSKLRERLSELEGLLPKLQVKLEQQQTELNNLHSEPKKQIAVSQASPLSVDTNQLAARADGVSRQLCAVIEQLGDMYSQLGFTLVRQADGQLTLLRASKVANTVNESLIGDNNTNNTNNNDNNNTSHSAVVPVTLTEMASPAGADWAKQDRESQPAAYSSFMDALDRLATPAQLAIVLKRVKDVEALARRGQRDARGYRERAHRLAAEAADKIAYRSFRQGDLALFLPTRNQTIRSWAAFNVGAPHYFLRETPAHALPTRDYLLARIQRVEERVVDLSRSDAASSSTAADDNPFDLSDGLRWYLLDAVEEKPRLPALPPVGAGGGGGGHNNNDNDNNNNNHYHHHHHHHHGAPPSAPGSPAAPPNRNKGKAVPARVDRIDARGSIRLQRPPAQSSMVGTMARMDGRRNSEASVSRRSENGSVREGQDGNGNGNGSSNGGGSTGEAKRGEGKGGEG